LSDFLLQGTIIIIDQYDTKNDLTNEEEGYLTELATDSYNSRVFRIVINVSCAKTAKTILNLNGRRKVKPLCETSKIEWDASQGESYMKKRIPTIAAEDVDAILKLVQPYYSPPLLKLIFDELEDHLLDNQNAINLTYRFLSPGQHLTIEVEEAKEKLKENMIEFNSLSMH